MSSLPSARPRIAWAAAVTLLASGCAMGPDFHPPAAPVADASQTRYTATALPEHTADAAGTGGAAQRFVTGADVSAQWWTLFQSPALNDMIQRALQHNPTLAAAQASLLQAQESYQALHGSLDYPTVSAQLNPERARLGATSTGVAGGELFTLFNASVNVSYTVDVFGANKRTLEAQRASVEYQALQLEAAYLSLTANVVTTVVREASLRAQLQATNEVLKGQEQQLQVVERQLAIGAIGRAPVLSQRNVVAQTRASLPPLEKALAQTRHQLAVYLGELPSEAQLAEFQLDALQLPQDLPVSLPSALVRQRPDIRASEAQLHQASAQVGVATANLYPQLTLTGAYGTSALTLQGMGAPAWAFWSLAAGLTQPLFNGGALDAKKRAAEAGYTAAAAQYRATVLQAFQNVADSLRALESDASALKAQAEAEDIAAQSLALSERQYREGALSYLALLDAQRNYQQARLNTVAARAARFADTAALFQALGGGWWNRDALATTASSTNP